MLTVVGMGPAGLHLMTPAAREAVADADVLVGGKRHLLQFPAFTGEQFVLGANIAELLNWIAGQRPAIRCFTASGRAWWPILALSGCALFPVSAQCNICARNRVSI